MIIITYETCGTWMLTVNSSKAVLCTQWSRWASRVEVTRMVWQHSRWPSWWWMLEETSSWGLHTMPSSSKPVREVSFQSLHVDVDQILKLYS